MNTGEYRELVIQWLSRRGLEATLVIVICLITVAALGQENKPADLATLLAGKLPKDFAVMAVGTNSDGFPRIADFQLDSHSDQVVQIEVVVDYPAKPVVLVLSHGGDTIWRVGRTPNTKLAAVIMGGSGPGGVIGIDKQTPLLMSTRGARVGKFLPFLATEVGAFFTFMNDTVKAICGREIESFMNKPGEDGVFRVGNVTKPTEVIYSADLKREDYVDSNLRPAGQRGLDLLVNAGKLRLATEVDIEAWVDMASERYRRFNSKLRVEHHMDVKRCYVVLGELTLPDGLDGGNSRRFIVPTGIADPQGTKGHNEFYFMDGRDYGPLDYQARQLGVAEKRKARVARVFDPKSPLAGKLPKDFVVYAVGAYSGSTMVPGNIQLAKRYCAVQQNEVVVHSPDKPVVLVLSNYVAMIWRIGRTPQTKIAAVIAGGYHAQGVIGIDKDVPLLLASHEKPGPFEYFSFSGAQPELFETNGLVRSLTGREIEHFYFEPIDDIYHVGTVAPDGAKLIYSADRKIEDYVYKLAPNAPLEGYAGLKKLMNDGKLRKANDADIRAWVDAASKKYNRFNPTLRISHDLEPRHTLVVLESLVLPDGLYGADSWNFIIPHGIPMPTGPEGHNSFYLMDGSRMRHGRVERD